MLQSIRNKASSWFALAIIFLALFSLTFFGIGDYFTSSTDTYVARVDDREIGQNEFRTRFQQWRERMRTQMGTAYDPRLFDQPGMRRQVLDRMVDEAVFQEANERMDLVVPASRLRSEIMSAPAFQIDGRYSEQAYQSFLASQRMTASELERRLTEDFATQILPTAVMDTAIVSDAEIDAYLRLSEQLRDFRLVRVDEPAEPVSEDVGEDEIQAWYDAHASNYMSQETATVEYVEIDAASIVGVPEATEETLRDRYQAEISRFGTPEQRLASHILVRPASDDADGQRQALAKAEEIAVKARAEDADFAEIARADSDDIGSKAQGGDLGWLGRGLTDPAFEDALFGMTAGTVSEPVRTEEGYHVIQLREVREATEKPFDEVREELAAEYLSSERERLYSDRVGELNDLILADPGSLLGTAEKLGLPLRTAGPFTRMSGEGPFANPSVRQLAFSDDILLEGNISEPVEVGDSHVVAFRVTDHVQSAPRPVAEVSGEIRASILAERRNEAVEARADALFVRLEGGEALTTLAEELQVEVETAEAVGRGAAVPDSTVVAEAFRIARPEGDQPTRKRVRVGDGYALIELLAVKDGDPAQAAPARREQVRSELQASHGRAEAQALLLGLRERSDIMIAEDRLQR